MKKSLKIILPVALVLAILLCLVWYLFVYDRGFTRDVLLSCARYAESNNKHTIAAWFYDQAYQQAGNNDAVAIELAEQYKKSGNYTQAQYTLAHAIADGGGVDLYIALCKTYVEQDKLLDAVKMLDNVSNLKIKEQLDDLRPKMPVASPEAGGVFHQYISVTLQAESGVIYATADGEYPSVAATPYSEPIPLADGENVIYALAIGENGLVSKLANLRYTIGGVVKKVDFVDSALEASVRSLLNIGEDTDIYTNDLWDIKSYNVPTEVKNYADLAHFIFLEDLTIENGAGEGLPFLSQYINLKKLKITGVPISEDELSMIANLPALKELTLNDCGLSNITAMSKATGLTYLDLCDNRIHNIDALSSNQNFQTLLLEQNAIEDLTPISATGTLSKLDVSNNLLTTITPITGHTQLSWLDAGANQIAQAGDLSKLTALTYLCLDSNKITDISGIATCTSLTELKLSGNQLVDISPVASLNQLKYLDFSHNNVTEIPSLSADFSLVSIDGSHNKIVSLDALSGLKKLNTVNMDYNEKISSVKSLASCPMLVEVNVYGTKVKDVSALTKLEIIVNYNPT